MHSWAVVGDGTMLERVTTLIEVASLYLDRGYSTHLPQAMYHEAAAIVARWPSTVRLDRQLALLRDRILAAPLPGRRSRHLRC